MATFIPTIIQGTLNSFIRWARSFFFPVSHFAFPVGLSCFAFLVSHLLFPFPIFSFLVSRFSFVVFHFSFPISLFVSRLHFSFLVSISRFPFLVSHLDILGYSPFDAHLPPGGLVARTRRLRAELPAMKFRALNSV